MDLPIWFVVLVAIGLIPTLVIAYFFFAAYIALSGFPGAAKWLVGVPLWIRDAVRALRKGPTV